MQGYLCLFIFLLFNIKAITCISTPKMQSCGDDLKQLINYLCTYPNEKLPCYQHFFINENNSLKENPLKIIDYMKEKANREDFKKNDNISNSPLLKDQNLTLIEQCCYNIDGCSIAEFRKTYCCFTKQCLDLCYPGEFDVFRF